MASSAAMPDSISRHAATVPVRQVAPFHAQTPDIIRQLLDLEFLEFMVLDEGDDQGGSPLLNTGQVTGEVTVPMPAPAIELFLSGAKLHPDKSPAIIGLDGVDSDGVRIATTAGRLLYLWLLDGLMGARVKALASDHVAWCIGYSRASRRHFFSPIHRWR